MRNAWKDGIINIGDNDGYVTKREEIKVNIYDCHPYCEGAAWDEIQINFCPFCGEEIKIEIEDVSDEQLKAEEKERNKKRRTELMRTIEKSKEEIEKMMYT
jgi:hypothetical protein